MRCFVIHMLNDVAVRNFAVQEATNSRSNDAAVDFPGINAAFDDSCLLGLQAR